MVTAQLISSPAADLHGLKVGLFTTFEEKMSVNQQTIDYMSRIMRKPAFCICENKGEDQGT